jgi:hypothetical protein
MTKLFNNHPLMLMSAMLWFILSFFITIVGISINKMLLSVIGTALLAVSVGFMFYYVLAMSEKVRKAIKDATNEKID